MPPSVGAAQGCTSSMKLRMKKMPRPLDLRRFSGRERIGDFLGLEALALVEHADDQLAGLRRAARR